MSSLSRKVPSRFLNSTVTVTSAPKRFDKASPVLATLENSPYPRNSKPGAIAGIAVSVTRPAPVDKPTTATPDGSGPPVAVIRAYPDRRVELVTGKTRVEDRGRME